MDVLEHLITVLRTALDYVGVDFDDLPHPEWLERRAELSTRYRSLVRLIATLLPPKPARRLRLQPTLIGHSDPYGGSLDSLLASFSEDPMADLDLTSEDIVWVEEDLGDNCIQLRPQVRQDVKPKLGRVEEMDKGLFVLRNLPDHKTSTPLNQSLSILSQTNPAAMTKISALEDELTKLRLQIAQIVVAQENATFQKSTFITDCVSVVREDVESEEPDGGDSPDGTDDVFPPPPASFTRDESLSDESFPPPPSPPPLTPDLSAAATPTSIPPPVPTPPPTMESGTPTVPVAQHAVAVQKPVEEGITPAGPPPSLTDVLRGLGSVKLRSVQRSPGGTPIRCPPKQVSHSDPTSLIAQALQKKFAFRNLHESPETDKENDFSSPDATPKTANIPRMLRKKIPRRRSSLCTESTDLIGSSATPLKDRNIRV